MKIGGAIFDLDGTLLDSMWVWKNLVHNFLSENYAIVPEKEFTASLFTLSMKQAAQRIKDKYLPDMTEEEIVRQINESVRVKYENIIQPKHGVKPFLFSLKCRGVRMCVATLTRRELAEAALRRLGMLDYFTCVLSCADIGRGKDVPDIYIKAHDILGTPMKDTYVFEDALYAVKTAKSAGFKVVGIRDDSCEDQKSEIQAICDIYINDYDDFRGMIT